MAHGRTFTEPALLVGLRLDLAMIAAVEHCDLREVRNYLATLFPDPLR